MSKRSKSHFARGFVNAGNMTRTHERGTSDSSEPAEQTGTEAGIVEFSLPLHVLRKGGKGGQPEMYTIGVWRGTMLESICLHQPLEAAVLALSRQLTSVTMKIAGAGGERESTGTQGAALKSLMSAAFRLARSIRRIVEEKCRMKKKEIFILVRSQIQRFQSLLRLRGVCGLLWAIRQFGFVIEIEEIRTYYEWVKSGDGGFDHWFTIDGEPHAICTLLQQYGFFSLAWFILKFSKLLVGRRRQHLNRDIQRHSETYYSSSTTFLLRMYLDLLYRESATRNKC